MRKNRPLKMRTVGVQLGGKLMVEQFPEEMPESLSD